MRRIIIAFYRAARAVLAQWLRGPVKVAELPDPDPKALARLPPGLRRLVEDARIVRAALLGEIDVMDAEPRPEDELFRRQAVLVDQIHRAHEVYAAATRAGALLGELVQQAHALRPDELDTLEARGFGSARMAALLGLLAPVLADDEPVSDDRPTSHPLRLAANELTALEGALLQLDAPDP